MQPQKIPLIMAPLAGITDSVFRRIVKQFGADIVYTEMVSAKGLYYGDKKTRLLLRSTEEERPVTAQLFGSDPAIMAEAARRVCEYAPDGIDINMGCPMPKIVKGGDGCALMRDVPLASRVCAAVAAAAAVPVSVKFRKGWDDSRVNAVEFAQMAEAAGADAVTVHGRTRQQMYAPPVDWEIIRQVKNAVSIPVIGNGDVVSPETAKALYETTGCDLIMIGRGALGAPWLFRQVRQYLQTGAYEPTPPLEKRMELMVEQMTLAVQYKGERVASHEARKHCGWYISGVRGAAQLRRRAGELQTLDDIKRLAEDVVKAAAE